MVLCPINNLNIIYPNQNEELKMQEQILEMSGATDYVAEIYKTACGYMVRFTTIGDATGITREYKRMDRASADACYWVVEGRVK